MRAPRFKLRSLMILVAIAALMATTIPIVSPLIPGFRSDAWSAGKDLPLEIIVVDERDGRPIVGASVRVRHSYRSGMIPPARGTTGDQGRVGLTVVADARGTIYAASLPWEPSKPVILRKTERLSLSSSSLDVLAAGYAGTQVDLGDRANRSSIVVRLRRSRGVQ